MIEQLHNTLFDGKRVELEKSIPLAGPLLVHIETTNRCNFKCVFCPESDENYQELSGGYKSMPFTDFKRIIDSLAALDQHPRILNFFIMGEPLMNKNISEYILYARAALPKSILSLSTNGALLTEKKFESLCKSGLDFLRVSIFGSSDEAHKKNTQTKVNLNDIKNNINNFVNYRNNVGVNRPLVYIKSILSPRESENQDFKNFFAEIGDKRVFEGLNNWNDDSDKYTRALDVTADKLNDSEHFQNKKYVCAYPFYSMIVHSDLKVSVCCIDWDKKTVVGDLKNQSVSEVWHGQAVHLFRMQHLNRKRHEIKACKNCTYHHTLEDNLDSLSPERYLEKWSEAHKLHPSGIRSTADINHQVINFLPQIFTK